MFIDWSKISNDYTRRPYGWFSLYIPTELDLFREPGVYERYAVVGRGSNLSVLLAPGDAYHIAERNGIVYVFYVVNRTSLMVVAYKETGEYLGTYTAELGVKITGIMLRGDNIIVTYPAVYEPGKVVSDSAGVTVYNATSFLQSVEEKAGLAGGAGGGAGGSPATAIEGSGAGAHSTGGTAGTSQETAGESSASGEGGAAGGGKLLGVAAIAAIVIAAGALVLLARHR